MPDSMGKRKRRDVTARKAAAREERRFAAEAYGILDSLQLGGTGSSYAHFGWQASATQSFGTCNRNQTFAAPNPPRTFLVTVAPVEEEHRERLRIVGEQLQVDVGVLARRSAQD